MLLACSRGPKLLWQLGMLQPTLIVEPLWPDGVDLAVITVDLAVITVCNNFNSCPFKHHRWISLITVASEGESWPKISVFRIHVGGSYCDAVFAGGRNEYTDVGARDGSPSADPVGHVDLDEIVLQ